MKISEFNQTMAYLLRPATGGRIPFATAGLADPENNVKKGQDLGEGIAQRLKYTNQKGENTIRYVTSGVKDTPIKEHKTFKDAQNYRKNLIEKYGDPKELGEYKGKYNYKELIKDKDFEDFWKAKVDGDKIATRTGKFKGEKSVEDAIQKVIKKYKLKPNDYEDIFNKVVEETRISEAVRKGTRAGQGKTKLISAAIIDNLIETFNKSYKPNVGTINTLEMEQLLKLPKGELSKLMSNIDKPYPKETLRFTKSDVVARINKAAVLKDILNQEGITYSKKARGGGEGTGSAEYRFKLDPDKNKASKKFKKLEKSKTFGFPKKTFYTKYPKSYKQDITTLSKQSDEYKKFGYGRDRNTILLLGKALNNGLRKMSDKELYKFVDNNPKLKNLVTSFFNAKTGLIENVPLKNMDMQQIRNNAQFEVDHIRGRATVDYDRATKKILDGLDIEYPKNLYIIPKAVNNTTKKRVENYVANNPNEKAKIKRIDDYFKKNQLTYFNRNTGKYAGYQPSKSAVDLSHLGITKTSELENLISGTYVDDKGIKRAVTKDPKKLIATLNELNKARGGVSLKDDIKIVKKHAASQGVKFNSFAGFIDFTDMGFELPPAVKQAATRILDTAGTTLRGVGKAAIVIDPVFAATDISEAFRKGASGAQAVDYAVGRFAEGLVNLPDLAVSGAKFGIDKLRGKDTKFETGVLYEPKTFGQDYLKRVLEETPEEVKEARKAQLEFDQTVRPGLTMVDDIDIPASKEEIDIAKDLFMKNKGVDLSVLDDIGMQEYTEDYMI
tara:strand:+ start:207 stop:2549 length:2343 start_codon:yes stop_codon:yes gene_type:complete